MKPDDILIQEKRIAADIVIAFLEKQDPRNVPYDPDKIADYFDIIFQRVSGVK